MSTTPSPTTTPNSAISITASSKVGDVFSTPVADDGQATDLLPSNEEDEEGDEEGGDEEEGEDDDGSGRGKASGASSKVRQSTSRPPPKSYGHSSSSRTGGSSSRPSGSHLHGASNKTDRRKSHNKGGCVLM